MPPSKQRAAGKTHPRPRHRSQPNAPLEVVDPIWLLKALALSVLGALLCMWLTLCLLFYQGEWQLILHPTHTIDQTPAAAGLAFSDVRFDATETGQPRLTGWWVPAQPDARYAAFTVLYFHDGSGSLSDTVPALARLHRAGLNVFAIDYRGFGASDASVHPTEARMAQDAGSALDYLTSTRHIPARAIIPHGDGLGASLAANLALHHLEFPAVIVANPNPDPTATAMAAHPSRIIPVRLLFRERFDIAAPLATLTTPKLLIAGEPASRGSTGSLRAIQTLFQRAASPSFAVTLPPANYEDEYQTALRRFLDQYLPAPPPPL